MKNFFFKLSKQVPCSYYYAVVGDRVVNAPFLHRGKDAVEYFLTAMESELKGILEDLCNPADMIITRADQVALDNAKHYHICNASLTGLALEL